LLEGGPYTKLTSGGVRTVADYTDTTAVSGTQYWYRVTAVDLAGNESPYAVTTAIRPTVDTTAPDAPTGLVTSAVGINDVFVDWDANNEPDLAGYNIYRSTVSGSGFVKQNVTLLIASEYRDFTTVASTTYYYRATAVDQTGNESVPSAEATWAVPGTDTTPPADPTGLVLVPSTSGILLSWTANTESDFQDYEVDRSATGVGGWSTIGTPGAATLNDTGAVAGAVNYYRIRARDNDNNWSGYLTGNATRPSGSVPAGSFVPTFVGTMVPCVIHARLIRKTNYSPTTGNTTEESSEFPSFASQNPLLYRYEFNFAAGAGEPQGSYPQLRGWNAAHIYDTPGTYTIEGTVTPPNGGTPVVYRTTRSVAADTRVPIYVSSSGSGTGSGLTEATAVTPTRAQAVYNAGTGPFKVLYKNGQTYNYSGDNPFLSITKPNTLVSNYGTGNRPLFVYSGPGASQRKFFHVQSGGTNAFLQNLQFDQSYTGVVHETFIYFASTNGAARNCYFRKADRCFSHTDNGSTKGVLIQTCRGEDDLKRDNFAGLCTGEDWVFLGCYSGNTLEEHPFRISGTDRVLVHDCEFEEAKRTGTYIPDDFGAVNNLQNGNFYYFRKCRLRSIGGGELHIGPLDQCTGQSLGRTRYVVYEQCDINSSFIITPGTHYLMLRNNYIHFNGSDLIEMKGYWYNHPTCQPTIKFDKGTKDIRIYNNTLVNTSGSGDAAIVIRSQESEQGTDYPVATGPVDMKNNYFVGGSGLTSTSANVDFVNDSLIDDSISADRNVWSSLVRFQKQGAFIDLAAWNALPEVGQDDAENVAFSTNFTPGVASKARTFGRPVQGVWEDYNGNTRSQSDSTWSAGAIQT
jgi:hypothetical protein